MKSILEEFANGNLDPPTQYFTPDADCKEILDRVCTCEQLLLDSLSAGDKALFEQFNDAQSDLNQHTVTQNFVYGYRLGVRMTTEIFSHPK